MSERIPPHLAPIKEEISPRAIEALMANYRDGQQAFLELVDNAVDNRIEGKPLIVRIRVSKSELVVHNQGGKGLDEEGLRKFFVWGYSEKTSHEIGFYGVGGKSAMGYLGKSIEVFCSSPGSAYEIKVSDPSWDSREGEDLKEYPPEVKPAFTKEGYFRVRISNLTRDVNASSLGTKLSDIYRPLLLDGSVSILVNGKQIQPIDIKYVTDDPTLKPKTYSVHTRTGETFIMKVGVLEPGQKVKPGIRCYYRGRLMEEEQFFGHPIPAKMPQVSRLTGEAHLDFVSPTPNKSSFIHSSVEWEQASTRANDVLTQWIEIISKLKPDRMSNVENWEKDIAKRAKRMLEDVFARAELISREMLPGESTGRREGSPRDNVSPPTGRTRQSGIRQGRTTPTLDATVGLETVKRWGVLSNWDVVAMGNPSTRSEIVEENGRKSLIINSDFPMYQAEKKSGEQALELYVGESAIMRVCEEVCRDKSIEEYLEMTNTLTQEWGELYQHRLPESATVRKRRKQT